MWKKALKQFNTLLFLSNFSFIYCIQANNQHKDGWFYKGYCEGELDKHSEANKRLFL